MINVNNLTNTKDSYVKDVCYIVKLPSMCLVVKVASRTELPYTIAQWAAREGNT